MVRWLRASPQSGNRGCRRCPGKHGARGNHSRSGGARCGQSVLRQEKWSEASGVYYGKGGAAESAANFRGGSGRGGHSAQPLIFQWKKAQAFAITIGGCWQRLSPSVALASSKFG